MNKQEHIVSPEENGMRIDKLLSVLHEEASRSQVQSWIKDNLVLVDDTAVKSNHKCQTEERIIWEIPEVEELQIEAENIPLDIIYEDGSLLVVNKPRGMVVHPSAGHQSGTLVNALLHHCPDLSGINGVKRPGIVHRIDKDTSGLLVVAKDDLAHTALADQLKDKAITRKYEAVVHGEISHEYGTIEAPIGRDPKDRQKMGVVEGGKAAVTHFEVLRRFPGFTHLRCILETGRTHQIRVHLKYIDHPVAGDPKYGPRKTLPISGQALHAGALGFHHPRSGEWLEFEAPLPEDMKRVLADLSK